MEIKLSEKQIDDIRLLDKVYLGFRHLDYSVDFSVEMTKAWAMLQK